MPFLRLLLPALILITVAASDVSAQSLFRPFHLQSGFSTAQAKARDTLAADARLVYAGTLGDYEIELQPGLPVTVNYYVDADGSAEAGMADAWGYVFYSPSLNRRVNLVVVNTFFTGGYFATGVDIDLPLPAVLTELLDLSINGTQSDSVIARLKSNSVFANYHAQYPTRQPNFVTLGMELPPDIVKPDDFQLNGPSWSMTFNNGRDTLGMVCLVSSVSGAVTCQLTESAAAPDENLNAGTITLSVMPNPANTSLRIALGNDVYVRGDVSMELLDARGARVLDLATSLGASGLRHADADVSSLANGVYFVRVTVNGVSTVHAVSIAR